VQSLQFHLLLSLSFAKFHFWKIVAAALYFYVFCVCCKKYTSNGCLSLLNCTNVFSVRIRKKLVNIRQRFCVTCIIQKLLTYKVPITIESRLCSHVRRCDHYLSDFHYKIMNDYNSEYATYNTW